MDILVEVLKFIAMLGAIALILVLLAALFMVIFSIATGVDEKLQE